MIQTYFAPAERVDEATLHRQIEMISQNPIVNTLLHIMVGILVILNKERQIVGLNHAYLEALGIDHPEDDLGLRLGESLGCVYGKEIDSGCGTSKTCSTCGAAIATMTSFHENICDEQLCTVKAEKEGEIRHISLLVRTTPIEIENQRFVVVALKDITKEQLHANLERVFFHDINNLLTSLLGPSDLLAQDMPERWEVKQINEGAKRLCQEIALQRELCLSGDSGFIAETRQVTLREINEDVNTLLGSHQAAKGKTIQKSQKCDDCIIFTDKLLAGRVLSNMLINALEATDTGGVVKLTTRKSGNNIVWEVWNNSWIPEQTQSRIFQRHFSTKSDVGRGLGTYSMKLFAETYLKGTIRFTSSQDGGTIFYFSLPLHQ